MNNIKEKFIDWIRSKGFKRGEYIPKQQLIAYYSELKGFEKDQFNSVIDELIKEGILEKRECHGEDTLFITNEGEIKIYN